MKGKFALVPVGFIFLFSASAFAQDYGKEHYSPNSPNYMAGQQHYLIKNESSSPLIGQQPENPTATIVVEEAILIIPLPVGGVIGVLVPLRPKLLIAPIPVEGVIGIPVLPRHKQRFN